MNQQRAFQPGRGIVPFLQQSWIAWVWLASMGGHYLVLGIRTGGDTGRYVDGAERLLKGLPLEGKQPMYLLYNSFLALVFGSGFGELAVILLQCLLTLGTALLIYLATREIFNKSVGMMATGVFLLNPDVQRWVFFILPEAMATCALIALLCLALLVQNHQRWVVPALLMAVMVGLARPEGKYFLLPVVIHWALYLKSPYRWQALSMLGIFIGLLLVTVNADTHEKFARHMIQGDYIWGYPGLNPHPDQALIRISEQGPFATLIYMLQHEYVLLGKTIAWRVWMFFAHTRPFYSTMHNLLAFSFCAVLYFFSILAWWRCREHRSHFVLLWLAILVQLSMVALTFDDWDGRWLNRVMPVLTILAAAGSVGLLRRLFIFSKQRDACADP
ncbi:MAG: glycosyltransferase family 39 protein [Magnetococcales bacterium]|nr:glycosyltransferase family 39 protein [Magnetococcales bacterium]